MKFFFCGGSNTDPRWHLNHHFYKYSNSGKKLKISELYPDIVSKYYNASYVNESKSMGSNKRTIRKIFYEYDMEEFDFICIDFTPSNRSEFYNDKDKKWERITVHEEFSKNPELCKLYYENFYNNEYGSIIQNIEFNIIKRYLKALNKPHLIFNSESIKNKNKNLNFDIRFLDYHTNDLHLSGIGHKQVAKHIIKYYENYLQRGQLDLGI